MILLVGIESEAPVRLVSEAAGRLGIDYVLLNQRKAHLYEISVSYNKHALKSIVNIDGTNYNLNDFSGIYFRMMDYSFLPEIKNKVFNYIGENLAHKSLFFHQQFINWIEVADCMVMNRSSDMLSNMSKPYQLQLIAQSGLKVPPTCITNDEDDVVEFINKYKDLIFKSSSSVRSIVKQLDYHFMNSMSRIKHLPTQFQKKLTGTNIRVHVAGDDIHSTKISSNTIDYRYAAYESETANLEVYNLSEEISSCCKYLSKQLNLPLCGIDLFLTDDGEYYCFEVNPSPGYSYYQENTGQDIASSIVNYLEFGYK